MFIQPVAACLELKAKKDGIFPSKTIKSAKEPQNVSQLSLKS